MIRNRKAFIIVISMVLAATLSVMAGGFAIYILYRNKVYLRHLDSTRAYYLASAGVNYVRSLSFYDSGTGNWLTPGNATFSISNTGDTCTVNSIKKQNTLMISAVSKVNGVTRLLSCDLEYVTGYNETFETRWKSGAK